MKKMRERYQDNMAIVPMNNMYSLTSTFIQKQNDYKPEIKNVGMSPKKKGLPRVLDLSDLDIIDTPKRAPTKGQGAQSKEKKGSVRVNRKPSEQGGDDKLAEKDTGVLIVNKVYPDDEKEINEEGVIVEIDEEDGYGETPLLEETIEELPEETIEELPEETIEELPEETIEELPEETIEELPEETIEELPEETIEETTEGPVVVEKKVGGSNNGDVKTIVVTSFF
jgi:hypothetical protein